MAKFRVEVQLPCGFRVAAEAVNAPWPLGVVDEWVEEHEQACRECRRTRTVKKPKD